MQKLIHKIIFSLPISLFLGVGILVSTDIIQPSYFRSLDIYWYYFVVAILMGYLAIFLATSYIESIPGKIKAYGFMIVFMFVEALFSLLAINTYYGSEQIPIMRQVTAVCLTLVFSLFYFMKIIDTEKTVKQIKDAQDIFKEFDRLESSKPDF
jgi:hypothetical protein